MHGTAEFSECGRFRYTLTRAWEPAKPPCCFIGLNPSTATAEVDDNTIRRCIGYARRWGFGGLLMLNLYAYRATLPADMWAAWRKGVDVTGGDRNSPEAMRRTVQRHGITLVVAAWGAHGRDRGPWMRRQWPELQCLGTNTDDSPKHPLYLKSDLRPIPFGTLVSA